MNNRPKRPYCIAASGCARSSQMSLFAALLLSLPIDLVHPYVSPRAFSYSFVTKRKPSAHSQRKLMNLYDDFQEFDSSMIHSTSDEITSLSSAAATRQPNAVNATTTAGSDLYSALRQRQSILASSSSSKNTHHSQIPPAVSTLREDSCIQNWKDAQCTSTIRLELDDWIRRIAIDTYPLAVVGSSQGHVYLTDLQSGQVLDCVRNVHVSNHKPHSLNEDTDAMTHSSQATSTQEHDLQNNDSLFILDNAMDLL